MSPARESASISSRRPTRSATFSESSSPTCLSQPSGVRVQRSGLCTSFRALNSCRSRRRSSYPSPKVGGIPQNPTDSEFVVSRRSQPNVGGVALVLVDS